MFKLAILLGASNAVLAILLGAFAAHGLRESLNERMLEVFHTAVQYHMYHALGLILVGLLISYYPTSRALPIAMYLMLFGIIVFSGSLYALSLTGFTKLGMITPIGGVAFIAAWVCVFLALINTSAN